MTSAYSKTNYEPKERGLYFARSYGSDNHYRYVVQVTGEPPFLRVEQVMDIIEGKLINRDGFAFYLWGPKIEHPEVPATEIEKRTNP
jgi:hypothetical protein